MQMNKKNKNFIRASDNVLKSKQNSAFEDKKEIQEGEEMTSNEMYQLLIWLKKRATHLSKQ